jgi:hypothetical protein
MHCRRPLIFPRTRSIIIFSDVREIFPAVGILNVLTALNHRNRGESSRAKETEGKKITEPH